VLLASHDMEEVAALADTVVCLDHGRVVGHWTAADFRGLAGMRRVGFQATRDEARGLRTCGAQPESGEEPREGERIRWVIDTDRSDVVAGLVLAAVPQPDLTVGEPGLGEIVERVLADDAGLSRATDLPRVTDLPRAADPAGCAR
jgi:ABC-2 type transport system ATP-binding protein